MLEFFGRLHPLVVHLPIGILIVAFIFEALSFYERHARLRRAVRPSLVIGFFAAVMACLTGLTLKNEGGYDDNALEIHQFLGLATAALTAVVFFLRKQFKTIFPDLRRRKAARILMLFVLVIALSVTGHLGGTLTHGAEYLSINFDAPQQPKELSMILSATTNHDSLVYYQDVIQPLLASRCFSCHSASKQKGELRLDQPQFISKGGKQGEVFTPGLADSSSLFRRLLLPLDDEKHMPPNEKEQLSSTDIALIQEWIDSGAKFDQRVASLPNRDRVKKFLASYAAATDNSYSLPGEYIDAADEGAIENLRKAGIVILPVNSESNYLMVNFTNARTFDNAWSKDLISIRSNVVWLDLSHSSITVEQLKTFERYNNLRYLYLNNTKIGDESIETLTRMTSMVHLNLTGTKVTDEGMRGMGEMQNLRNVFLFNTQVTAAGVNALRAINYKVVIDTGNYKLETLPTDTIVHKRKSS